MEQFQPHGAGWHLVQLPLSNELSQGSSLRRLLRRCRFVLYRDDFAFADLKKLLTFALSFQELPCTMYTGVLPPLPSR